MHSRATEVASAPRALETRSRPWISVQEPALSVLNTPPARRQMAAHVNHGWPRLIAINRAAGLRQPPSLLAHC